ncbi:hypothetical protein [Hyunsoonleella aestuarii]|uniref:DUF4382 domain-containing protein n=1 Tax=Hyunsoonleella aestuarii TaxID=912802 RepID=A0ABP8E7C5_9FLAO|nr:hypothetical protein [Hyunsoonleella aestuarii]
MKKIINILVLPCLILFSLSSCEEEEKDPFYKLSFDEIETGAYFRSILAGGTVNLNDLDNSVYNIQGELVTPEAGADVESIELWVEFKDRSTDSGDDDSVASTFVTSISSSSLPTNSNGFPEHTFNMTIPEAMTALGLDSSQISGGDQFFFQVVIIMTDGRVFDKDTSGDSIKGELFFASPFEYTATVVCIAFPIPGDWVLDMIDLFGDGWNGGNIVVSLDGVQTTYFPPGSSLTEIITVAPGTSEFTFTYTAGGWEGENLYTLTDPNGVVVLDEGVGDYSQENGPREGELLNVCPD